MIPSNNTILSSEFNVVRQSSKTYKMRINENCINGNVEDAEAMVQAIYKILNTERYDYIIYSWNYGVELYDLFGKPVDYVCLELKRRIEEALIQDDRIISVNDFYFDTTTKGTVKATFTVRTIYGDVQGEKAVNI